MKNVFDKDVTLELITRINKLTPQSVPVWGKMNVAQMLAHCNVTYEMVYENKHPKPNFLMKLMLKLMVKKEVVTEKIYKRSSQTAPAFLIKGERTFHLEKDRLISYINKTQQHGEQFFDNKESHSFGKLKSKEWNNMFYKHLDHHLKQFGV